MKRAKTAPQGPVEDVRIQEFLDMIAPSIVKFNTDHFICGNTFRCVWALREYPTKLLKTTNTHSTSGNSMRRKIALKAHKSSIQRCFTLWSFMMEQIVPQRELHSTGY